MADWAPPEAAAWEPPEAKAWTPPEASPATVSAPPSSSGVASPKDDLSQYLTKADPNALAPGVASTGGGIDLEGMHVTAGGPGGMPLQQELNKPLVSLPKPQGTDATSSFIRGAETAAENVATTQNVGIGAAASVLPTPLQKAVSIGFGASMLSQLGDQYDAFKNAKTTGEKAEIAGGATLNLILGGLAIKHGVTADPELLARNRLIRPGGVDQKVLDAAIKNAPEPSPNSTLDDPTLDGIVAAHDKTVEAAKAHPENATIPKMAGAIQWQLSNVPEDRINESRARITQQAESAPPAVPPAGDTVAPLTSNEVAAASSFKQALAEKEGQGEITPATAASAEMQKAADVYDSARLGESGEPEAIPETKVKDPAQTVDAARFQKVVDSEIGGLHEALDETEALDHMEGVEDDNVRAAIAKQYGIDTEDKSANDLNTEIAEKAMEVKNTGGSAPEANTPIAAEFEHEEYGGLPKQQLGSGGTMTKRIMGSEGPGAAAETEFPALQKINITNASVDERRATEGNLKLLNEEVKSNPSTWADVENRVDKNPNYGSELVDKIRDGTKKSVDHIEQAALIHESIRVKNLRDQWAERAADVNTSEADRAEAHAESNRWDDRLNEVDQATKIAGTSAGRALQIRRMQINDDFTYDGIKRKMAAEKGDNLSPEEKATAKAQAEEFSAKEKERDAAQAKVDAETLSGKKSRMIEATINELGKSYLDRPSYGKQVWDIARKTVERWKNEASGIDLDKEIGKFFGSESGGIGGVGGGKGGGRKLGESNSAKASIISKIALKIRADIGEFGLKKADAISDYVGKYGEKIRDIANKAWDQAQKLISTEKIPEKAKDVASKGVGSRGEKTATDIAARAKAEASIKGGELTSKTAYEAVRSAVNSGVRGEKEIGEAALKILNPAFPDLTMNELDVKSTRYGQAKYPSQEETKVVLAKQMRLRQMQAAIEDVKARGETSKSGVQRAKADADVRQRQSELKTAIEQYGKETPATPEQIANREAAAIRTRQNAIEDLNRELTTGEKKLQAAKKAQSTQVEQLQSELDAMRELKSELDASAKPKSSPDDIAAEAAQKGVDAANAAHDRMDRILKGEIEPETKSPTEPKSNLEEEIRSQTDAMKRAWRELKKNSDPESSSDQSQLKALEKSIADYERKAADIRSGQQTPTLGKRQGPDTEAVAKAKAARDAAKKVVDDLEKARKPVKTPDERYNETQMKRVQKAIEENKERLRTGNFATKPKPTPYQKFDPLRKAQAELDRVKDKVNQNVARIASENRTKSQKFWDGFVGIQRAMKLSSDVVLAKLTLAAAAREAVLTPVEEGVGGAVSKVLPRLAERAPREGGLSPKAEINAKAQFFTKGMADAWNNLRMRASDLESTYGNKKPQAPPAWYEYIGFLHGALKAPVKRAEFARSLTKRMAFAEKAGENLNDPDVMLQLSQESYIDANRAIFMQDNVVSKAFNAATGMMAKSKIAPNLGPALARIAHFLVPIVKVPTNIVGEVATGIHGTVTGSLRAANAYVKGIDSLPPEQADAIMRQLKKGLIGNAILLTGYLGYKSIGGFYHQNDKRSKSDVQPGYYRVGSTDLPPATGHSTAGMLLDVGSTIHRVEDELQSAAKGGGKKGIGSGILAATSGLTKELPAVPAISGVATALESEDGFMRYIHEMITSTTTPGISQHVAKLKDTPGSFPSNILKPATRRSPQTNLDAVKMGVPGLREQVPKSKVHR